MFNWFIKSKPPKEDWELVKELTFNIQWTNLDNKIETIYYYLIESNLGNRKYEAKTNDRYAGEQGWVERSSTYLQTIHPWLKGKSDPSIPSYFEVRKNQNERHIKLIYRQIKSGFI